MTVIDTFLKNVDSPQKKEIERIRTLVKEIVPDAKEVLSYGMPAFTYKGQAFLGCNVYKNHIGIYPFGGEVIEVLKEKLDNYELSKGAIRVPFDEPMPKNILKEIIDYRLEQIDRKLGS